MQEQTGTTFTLNDFVGSSLDNINDTLTTLSHSATITTIECINGDLHTIPEGALELFSSSLTSLNLEGNHVLSVCSVQGLSVLRSLVLQRNRIGPAFPDTLTVCCFGMYFGVIDCELLNGWIVRLLLAAF
jgi:hypothetical protein